jgi:transcriptional regulator with XRE-family HTH domain
VAVNLVTKSIFHPSSDEFRHALTAARKGVGLSQSELAERLEKPQSFVSKYERGERRLDVLEFFQVADAMNIDPFHFLEKIYRNNKRGKSAG